MLGIGWSEIFLICIVGLIFVKPSDIPHLAKSLAKTYKKVTDFTTGVRSEFNSIVREAELDELDQMKFDSIEEKRKAYQEKLLDDHK